MSAETYCCGHGTALQMYDYITYIGYDEHCIDRRGRTVPSTHTEKRILAYFDNSKILL
jgi:hypothetical protein